LRAERGAGEVHPVDTERGFGGFYDQLLDI
jgi:hypothetical protein